MKTLFSSLLTLVTSAIFSCQIVPTKVTSTTQLSDKSEKNEVQEWLKKNPVVLDARSPLDFAVSHSPGAISIQWQDFSKQETGLKGMLLDDDFDSARRLSLWGIDPTTPVLVVGNGLQGQGEEGRIAWMLKYLGVKEIQITHWTNLRSTIPRPELAPVNKSLWKPKPDAAYLATWDEFKAQVFIPDAPLTKAKKSSRQGFPIPASRKAIVLDVGAFEDKVNSLKKAVVPVKKIFWKDFLNEAGQPELKAKEELARNNIDLNQTIYVISENGVSSALVTFILRSWGYRAKNYAGGFDHLKRYQLTFL